MGISLPKLRKQTAPIAQAIPAQTITPAQTLTVGDVDRKLAHLEGERTDLQDRAYVLQQAIAAGWDGDTTNEENEFARVQARLGALEIVKGTLESERREAFKRDLLAAYEVRAAKVAELTTRHRELNAEIVPLEIKLHNLIVERQGLAYDKRTAAEGLIYALSESVDATSYGRGLLAEIQNEITAIKSRYEIGS